MENGPQHLELLFRAIVYHPAVPILIADNEGHFQHGSAGVGRLLGLPPEAIVGRPLDDFAPPTVKPQVSQIWRDFLENGEQRGVLPIPGPDGTWRDVEYVAKGNVLPVQHVLAFRDKTVPDAELGGGRIPLWVQDYALCLLDREGFVAAWYAGSARIYGYAADEAVGQPVSLLYPQAATPHEELTRAAGEGHIGTEGWQVRKDGSRFWANAMTMALRDGTGELQGFARAVRNFSDRHEQDEKRRNRTQNLPAPSRPAIAGIVCGESDRAPDANDAFLDMVGFDREDLLSGRLLWPNLTPPEYAAMDELAHEEGLRFGACTPYEKELIRKDGSRVPVLVTTAVLNLCPFRWITFVQDSRERSENVEPEQDDRRMGDAFDDTVGQSTALKRVLRQTEVVAPTDATVLILGETGTGKELVARAIHRLSPRKHLPFISLNCAAIPTGLLESELFGYEKGAFTGALSQKLGRFELANRGTLFLDEVGDIPLDLQPKLLRALQEKSFERLGGTKTIPIDVRLVAATNRNLTQMMGDQLFRSDLYYRLKVFPITVPPLRDRPEDIPHLVRHFTAKYAARMGRQIERIPTETMRALASWHWPGNIRELENFVERAVILSSGTSLRAPVDELQQDAPHAPAGATLDEVDRHHILRVLRESGGVVTKAATRLGLHRTTLNAVMRRLGISRKDL